jgi:predicted Fe-Mo cluster-binding NifX family protein
LPERTVTKSRIFELFTRLVANFTSKNILIELEELKMKIVVTAKGNSMDSQMDQRFGRADYFLIVETDTGEFETVNNAAAVASGGAGIASAQLVVEKGVRAVITGNVGPNALSVLRAAEITIYKGQAESVRENIELFKKGTLEKLETAVPAHSGMGPAR